MARNIAERDADVPLSLSGARQSDALGQWVGSLGAGKRPEIPCTLPRSARARRSGASSCRPARRAMASGRSLREKEFGILDGLTVAGIRTKFPDLAEQRQRVGKFYFRPPGGESWCDVILRLRSLLELLTREQRGERVLIVGHQVIVCTPAAAWRQEGRRRPQIIATKDPRRSRRSLVASRPIAGPTHHSILRSALRFLLTSDAFISLTKAGRLIVPFLVCEETTFDRSRVTTVDWASYRLLRFPVVPRLGIALIELEAPLS